MTGSHVLQIKGYSLTKGLGIGKFIKSSTFCVCGHRWYIRYYPDGDCLDSADWISIYLQHDHTDAVDVKARFKFSVLDDIGEPVPTFSQKSCMRTFSSSKGGSWGFNKFVPRKALEESSYLKDDCLKVRCDITVSKEISTEATLPQHSVSWCRRPTCTCTLAASSQAQWGPMSHLMLPERCLLHTGAG